jgi:hypothetical protein
MRSFIWCLLPQFVGQFGMCEIELLLISTFEIAKRNLFVFHFFAHLWSGLQKEADKEVLIE